VSAKDKYDFILDAWALLAHFGNESGAERIREVLKSAEKHECTAGISLINLGEILYITERERGLVRAHEVLGVIHSLPIDILPVEEEIDKNAAHIKANYRLSYADAFAAATAMLYQGTLLTGDPELKSLNELEISVEWLPG
jgi:predicted nucleic acid-binding protein